MRNALIKLIKSNERGILDILIHIETDIIQKMESTQKKET